MKRKIILILLALAVLCPCALAVTQGVDAAPNQQLHFRTGPNTAFTDLCVLPKSTAVTAIELEEGNGVTWVLCDFEYNGNRARGYTGLKRLDLVGDIPWASHYRLERTLVSDGNVYAAPDDTTQLRATLLAGNRVTFLDFAGSFCFVEYRRGGALERGYIHESAFWVDHYEFGEWFPDNPLMNWYAVRSPAYYYTSYLGNPRPAFAIPYDRSVVVDFSADLPGDWISIYYAGKWGFGQRGDFNDLRGFVEPGY